MAVDPQRKPFLYTLTRGGDDGQDLYFERIRDGNPSGKANVWGMHLDIYDDPTPAKVLILVKAQTERATINHEIDKAQSYFSRQIEPRFLEPEGETP